MGPDDPQGIQARLKGGPPIRQPFPKSQAGLNFRATPFMQ